VLTVRQRVGADGRVGGTDTYHGLGHLKQLSTEAFKVLPALHQQALQPSETYVRVRAAGMTRQAGLRTKDLHVLWLLPHQGHGPSAMADEYYGQWHLSAILFFLFFDEQLGPHYRARAKRVCARLYGGGLGAQVCGGELPPAALAWDPCD